MKMAGSSEGNALPPAGCITYLTEIENGRQINILFVLSVLFLQLSFYSLAQFLPQGVPGLAGWLFAASIVTSGPVLGSAH